MLADNFNFHKFIGSIKTEFTELAKLRGQAFKCTLSSSTPKMVSANEKSIRKIIGNLIKDAFEENPKSEIIFEVSAIGTILHFEVKIDGDVRDVLEIPFVLGKEVQNQEKIAPTAEVSFHDAKILIVDDLEMNLVVTSAVLGKHNIKPDTAISGKTAIKMAKMTQYDLILMDYMMPEMDGIETMEKIRELNEKYAHAPIIALTANTVVGAEDMLREKGFDDYLPKPIDMAHLQECLSMWIPPQYKN